MLVSILRTALFVFLFGVPAQALAAGPAATTSAASGITTSSAVLNGIGTPNGQPTTGRFRYSSTNPGTCNDTFGTRVPAASGTDLGTGSSAVPYSITTTGLSPGVTYYFCAIVSNTSGTAFGAVLSFTIPSSPVVVTASATSVTSSSATLQGSANPVAATTTAWFRYSPTDPGACSDTFGTRTPSSGGTAVGSGITSVPYSGPIGGLTPATTYYFCAIANNSYGTSFGAVLSFTTPATVPAVTTSGASSLTRTTGVLNGYANPGGDTTTGWFRYSVSSPGTCNDTFGTRAPATGGAALGAGSSSVTFGQAITGLSPGVTYYYCAIASNSIGTAWGTVQTFITPASPTAVTLPASSLAQTSATLNGSGNPNRAATSGWFRYALTNPGTCDDKFGSRAPVTGSVYVGSDTTDTQFSQGVTGLSSGTTYYYCAIVASTEGTAFGAVLSFTTSGPAVATTGAVTSVNSTTATLTGTGNPNGASALGWFRYSSTNPGSCNDTFGTRAPTSSGASLGSGATSVAFGQPITGLSPGVTYYYCAIANNTYGTGFGAVQSFITPASPPTVSTDFPTGIAINLNGSANPNGSATLRWFIEAFEMTPDDAATLLRLAGSADAGDTLIGGRAVVRAGVLPPRRHRTVSLRDCHRIGPDGLPESHRTVQVIRAEEELDRYPCVFDTDAACFRVVKGGRCGEPYALGDGLFAIDILLDEPLAPGETTAVEYETTFWYRTPPPPEFRRAAVDRLTDVDLRVQFHHLRLPRRVWCSEWPTLDAPPARSESLRLDADKAVQRSFPTLERTVVGFRWEIGVPYR